MKLPIALSLTLLLIGSVQADTILFEDFEDASVLYTSSHPDDFSDVNAEDYFGRVGPDGGTLPANGEIVYSNTQGSGFYTVHDTDGTSSGNVDLITLDFTGIDISNFTNLDFSFLIAEDDDGADQDWDQTSSFRITYQLDGGGFQNLFAVESEIGTDGNQTNEEPRVDTDFDGTGDGIAMSDIFTLFSESIADGSVLDIRLEFEDLDTGDEDLAVDNILLTGDSVVVPEPCSIMMLGTGLALVCLRRRRA